MKTIIVKDYVKWTSTERTHEFSKNHVFHAHRHGYWNVFQYTAELEKFLQDHNIEYSTKENSF